MNFLAHTYLSNNNTKIAIGNLIGDMVKGDAWKNYEREISIGLQLHRSIDDFTDRHPVFVRTRDLVKPYFNRYSGIATDIFYDHFLARKWNDYHPQELQKFVNKLYINLIRHYAVLPPRGQRVIPFMILRNWLGTYGYFEPLHQIFLGMHRRTQERGNLDQAVEVLQKHYQEIDADFVEFFPDLVYESRLKLSELYP
jgi:acyl carrier protein phosphodiesterase